MKENGVRYFLLLLFFTFVINLCFPGLSVRTEGMALPDSSSSAISFHDLAGHWAEKTITAWTMRELSGGYPDGTFRPDNPITRAEFAALVNRAFGFSNMAVHLVGTVPGQATGSMTYSDVAETDWYAGEIAREPGCHCGSSKWRIYERLS